MSLQAFLKKVIGGLDWRRRSGVLRQCPTAGWCTVISVSSGAVFQRRNRDFIRDFFCV